LYRSASEPAEQIEHEITARFVWVEQRRREGQERLREARGEIARSAEKVGEDAARASIGHPTRGKPLLVLMWLSFVMRRVEKEALRPSDPGGFMKMAGIAQLNAMQKSILKLDKIDTLALPMPYNQLLKTFLLAWTFTLPFVIAAEMAWFTPFAMLLISVAFFGLDQVGAMLEQPFGTDPADISLLSIGAEVAHDLDGVLHATEGYLGRRVEKPASPSGSRGGKRSGAKRVKDAADTLTTEKLLREDDDELEEDEEDEEEEEDDDDAADDDGGDDGGE